MVLEILSVIIPGIVYFGRYVILSMASKAVSDWLRPRLVKTEHEATAWLLHKHKAMGKKVTS